jgi:hypothetical protein
MAMNQSRQRGNIGMMQVQICQGGPDEQNLIIQWFKRNQVMGITTTNFFIQGGGYNNRQSPHPIVISSISPLGGGNSTGGSNGGIRWP